jgi:uncharacterized RDD family membrane protein YckC
MTQKPKTNFRSRLIAFIIDLSIIYGLAFIVYNLLQLFYIHISTVNLSLIIAIIYFPIITIKFKASIGKILCGLIIENKSKRKYSIAIFLREFIYKQSLYLLLIYGSIKFFRLEWLSPYIEIVYVFILCLILFITFLFRKKTWYDRWANTIVIKNIDYEKVNAKRGIAFLLSVVLVVIAIRVGYFISISSFNNPFVPKHSKNVLAPYILFLKKQKDAKDYIFELFEKNDMVILCERGDHPEMTQYDFIYDIVSDKRFIENVGNICSEIGSVTQQANLDSLMNTDRLSNSEVELKLVKILRNYSFYPIWEHTNYFNYFKKLYALNQNLQKSERIQHTFTDLECNWDSIKNKTDYSKIKSNERNRDKILADHVIQKYERMLASNQNRHKCLVIMNYRHAFGPVKNGNIENGDNCATYIMNKYPDKVANVMLNQVRYSFGLSHPCFPLFFKPFLMPAQVSPINEGIWDNSFQAIGNKSLGFDFKKSPFGQDEFDLFIKPNKNGYKYQDIFTGFVFYNSLEDQYDSFGFKNIIANGFDKEIINRATRINDSDLDNNLKYYIGKLKMLRRQEITTIIPCYKKSQSIFELLFGSLVLILGLIFGLVFYITKRRITKA